ncbi:MAG: hypothetical protein Q7S66_05930 [bacterium]|nr:hypothetical protein [bacterium]
MNRYAWWFSKGLIIVLPVFILYVFSKSIIEYGDAIWNKILFQPFFSRDIPFLGFILSIVALILIGLVSETRFGKGVQENLISRIPVVGKMFTSLSPKSQQAVRKVNGFIFAPIWGGYRPARVLAVFPIGNGGHMAQLWFPIIPPTTQVYPDSTIVYAIRRRVGEVSLVNSLADSEFVNEYAVFPTEIGLRVEFSGGTTVPERSFIDLVPVTLGEFLHSQHLVNGSE